MTETVLVVEDDAALRQLLAAELGADGSAPVLATAAGALLELRRGLRPDVLVVDLDARDCLALLADLDLAAETIPVVALSASPRRLLAAGMADAVLVKPFEPGRLRRCVAHACCQPRGAA